MVSSALGEGDVIVHHGRENASLEQKGFSADLTAHIRAAKGSPALGREARPVSGLLWFRFWTLESTHGKTIWS